MKRQAGQRAVSKRCGRLTEMFGSLRNGTGRSQRYEYGSVTVALVTLTL
jgi:hypothetical protein